jgi:hypothetical protein
MADNRLSVASDRTVHLLSAAEVNKFQSSVTTGEFAKADPSQLRIYVFDQRATNATRLDRSGNSRCSDFYDFIKGVLLMATNTYFTEKGTTVLTEMADIWIKEFFTTSKDPTKDAKAAVKAWQDELRVGNLPPVVVSWSLTGDGHTHCPSKPATSLKSKVQSLESLTISLNGPVSCTSLF